jgi:hypothetical protein
MSAIKAIAAVRQDWIMMQPFQQSVVRFILRVTVSWWGAKEVFSRAGRFCSCLKAKGGKVVNQRRLSA